MPCATQALCGLSRLSVSWIKLGITLGITHQRIEPEYPAHFEVRWVSECGTYKWKRQPLFISQALGHEWIAFEETGDGIWSVYFYNVLLARLDERDFKLRVAVP